MINIKDSSGNIGYIKQISSVKFKENFKVLIGKEKILKESLLIECHGLVPSIANVFPKLLIDLYEACIRKDYHHVVILQKKIGNINKINKCYDG